MTPPLAIQEMFKGVIEACGERCLPAFVFKHGVVGTYRPLPNDIKMMKKKQCFRNALMTAALHDQLIYCEGYAHNIFPTHHAWCIDKDGYVVDPTWRNVPSTVEYFGIPFDFQFAMQTAIANRYYGLLGDYGCRNVVEADPDTFIAKQWRNPQ